MPIDWGFPFLRGVMLYVLPVAIIWSAAWKGVALWRAGRNAHLGWFIALFLLNTLGILEIIYIFGFSKRANNTAATIGGG